MPMTTMPPCDTDGLQLNVVGSGVQMSLDARCAGHSGIRFENESLLGG